MTVRIEIDAVGQTIHMEKHEPLTRIGDIGRRARSSSRAELIGTILMSHARALIRLDDAELRRRVIDIETGTVLTGLQQKGG
jgi:hypothetical protein